MFDHIAWIAAKGVATNPDEIQFIGQLEPISGTNVAMRTLIAAVVLLASGPACADPYCDTLLGFLDDAPKNAVVTVIFKDRSGDQTVARTPLPGARCQVSPYNPTGVAADHPPEQSVYCFWNGSDDSYRQLLDENNRRVAACLGQQEEDDTFSTRFEYGTNLGFVRVSAEQMTDDWAVSVTIMPVN
jgi:hypothetical protein